MALDEPKDSDNVYDVNGFQFIVDKNFYEQAKPVKVDFLGYGFQITSGMTLDAGCSGCGSSGGCG